MYEHESKEWRRLDVYPLTPEGETPRGFDGRVTAIRGYDGEEEFPTLVRIDGGQRDFESFAEWNEYNAKINMAVARAFAWLAEVAATETTTTEGR